MAKMKKRVPPREAQKILSKVPVQYGFWLCTNEEMRSVRELAKSLDGITDDVFRYHVNRDKNDFEAWIRDVVTDRELAREIARVKTKETLRRKVQERVEQLSIVVKRRSRTKKTAPSRRRKKKAVRHSALRKKVRGRKKARKIDRRSPKKAPKPKSSRQPARRSGREKRRL